ncbi:MAG: hypothetical protein ACRD2W_21835, partial [Acidimicrobiales bacterium]
MPSNGQAGIAGERRLTLATQPEALEELALKQAHLARWCPPTPEFDGSPLLTTGGCCGVGRRQLLSTFRMR